LGRKFHKASNPIDASVSKTTQGTENRIGKWKQTFWLNGLFIGSKLFSR
jgi:hypothetical protein